MRSDAAAMVSRKRTRSNAVDNHSTSDQHRQQQQQQQQHESHDRQSKTEDGEGDKEQPGLLQSLRNCWELANLMQFIQMFGQIFKIDESFDIETLEEECLKPGPSEKLLDIGLRLLKFISSRRDLTYDNFDEHTRRQYNRKAPHQPNPFGYDEEPLKFSEFDVFLKLRVLHQLTVWTFTNPDNIRRKLPDLKEHEQTEWRVEEIGYDRKGRSYYVLDDNRLYRRTDPPLPPPKPIKPKTVAKSARAIRASKRRKLSGFAALYENSDEDEDEADNNEDAEKYTGEFEWECVAITLVDYQRFIDSIQKTKDGDEKILRDTLLEQILPFMESIEEGQQRKRAKREKELLNLQLLSNAKRSNRIAVKAERERHEREASEDARRHKAEAVAAVKEQERRKKMEKERQSRVMSREQRMKDREQKRLQHEAELARIADEQKKLERGEGRISERHLQAELAKQEKSLQELNAEDHWVFDCSGCGVHGENLDDGSHSVACEKCNVWQHSKCLGIEQGEAEKEDFQFVCSDCTRREEEARLPKLPPLKFRVETSSSPPNTHTVNANAKKALGDAPSPVKRETRKVPLKWVNSQPNLPPQASYPSSPPKRRPLFAAHSQLTVSPQVPQSPLKGAADGSALMAEKHQGLNPNHHSLPPGQHQQAEHVPAVGNGSFTSQRPSSSHSVKSPPNLPSPIQNRPSMSPTQGNRDVGPLAGFPSTAPPPENSTPWTPFGQRQVVLADSSARSSSSSAAAQNGHASVTAATPSGASLSHSSPPPQNSHGIASSGISPMKQSPRPLTSGGMVGAPIMPPVQKLEPRPKLMGRSSPDAPIPPPVKSMSPEQEQRRQLENAILKAETEPRAPLNSSPSFDIPPLGPSAVGQQLPSMSPSTAQGDRDHNVNNGQ